MKLTFTPVASIGSFVLGLVLSVALIPFPGETISSAAASPALPATIRGIRIHYQYDPVAFFPRSWLEPPVSCAGSQVDLLQAQRAVPLIRRFADVYGASSLRDHLADIYLLGDLDCYGQEYGGTNSTASIYLRLGAPGQGYDEHFVLSTLHAEFSSVLWRKHTFPAAIWQAANPSYFAYPNNAVSVLEAAGITDQPPQALLCGGFLSRYGMADLEDDFNDYAGALFADSQALCAYRAQCGPIGEKARLAIQFYRSVDPGIRIPACG